MLKKIKILLGIFKTLDFFFLSKDHFHEQKDNSFICYNICYDL